MLLDQIMKLSYEIKLQRYKDRKIKNLNNIFSFAKLIFKDINWDLISIYNLN